MFGRRSKIISRIEADENIVSVKPPFLLEKDRKRRYIRLEVSQPVTFTILKERSGNFWPQGNGLENSGSILNISAGGILVESDCPIDEGSILVLKMSLLNIEIIDNVLGIVKRAEIDDGKWLIGIEFISQENLSDYLSAGECDIISKDLTSFNEQIKRILNRHVYYKRVSAR
jgi:hypothetical protein